MAASAARLQAFSGGATAPFPLAAFLASLPTIGIRLTLRDYDRIALVLGTGGRWDLDRLRRVLKSLLARDADQAAAFERRFAECFGPEASPVEFDAARALAELRGLRQGTSPKPERRVVPRKTGPRLVPARRQLEKIQTRPWLAALSALVMCSILLVASLLVLPRSEQPQDVERVVEEPKSDSSPEAPAWRRYPDAPAIAEIRPLFDPAAQHWKTPAALSGLLLLAALGYGLWLWRARRSPGDVAPPWNEDLPRFFDPGAIGARPAPWLDGDTLDHLADSLGYFRSEQPGRRLDVAGSVAATMDGGYPKLVFERRRQVRSVIVLEDEDAEPLRWNPIAEELAQGLLRRGVPVIYGRFRGVPEPFYRGSERRAGWLEDLEDHRYTCLLLVFSDGKGLRNRRDRFVLESLSRWPMATWLEPREPRAWDDSSAVVAAAGIALEHASREGLLRVMERFMTEHGAVEPPQSLRDRRDWRGRPPRLPSVPLKAHLESLLGDALPWAQACAMMLPPLSPGLADALRRRFHPELPPQRLERLYALPGTTVNPAGLRFGQAVLAVLRSGFVVRWDAHEQRKVLDFILEQIRTAEPADTFSPAHLAWEWRQERVRLEADPDEALKRLSELAQGPLGDAIKGELSRVTVAETPREAEPSVIPLREKPRTRAGLQRLRGLAQDCGVAESEAYPVVWVHRAAVGALAMAGVLFAGFAVWEYLQTAGRLILALDAGGMPKLEAILERREGDGWTPVVAEADERGPRWTVQRDTEYRLALANEGAIALHSRGTMTESHEIALKPGVDKPCRETLAEIGLTVLRCPPGIGNEDEAVIAKNWRERLGDRAPPGRLLSVGLEIGAGEAITSLGETLLRSGSVDRLYRITAAAEDMDAALAWIAQDLGPWRQRTQLVWWVAEGEAGELALPEDFGRVLALGEGAPLAGMAAVIRLLAPGGDPLVREREILAAAGAGGASGPGEPIAWVRGATGSEIVERPKEFQDRLKDGSPGPVMVRIPGGEFMMGSPETEEGRYDNELQHRVVIERPFAIGKYEVTFAEYDRFADATGREKPDDRGWGRGDRPVIMVSWEDAVAYAEWLSAQTGEEYRLPTEAEWEYAARAGTTTAYWWGNEASHEYENYGKDECCGGLAEGRDQWIYTSPKGSFPSNPFGLHDMLGNVWERTCSEYDAAYGGAEQVRNIRASGLRVIRGGSWSGDPRGVRAGARFGYTPDYRYTDLGFRLARTLTL